MAILPVACLLLIAALTGCGSGTNNSAGSPTVTITASPATITAGGTAVLTVVASNDTQVTVTGSDGSSYTLSAIGGTISVKPTTTTSYTAIAHSFGVDASANTTVTVNAALPATVAIVANPTSITAGGSSVLTVTATNATQVTIAGSDGSSYTLPAAGGTQTVTPTASTTYTATAHAASGNVTATATVTVGASASPTITLTANPTSIASGGTSVLTAVASNATQVKITGSDGSSYTLAPSGGTQSVTPATTTTYTATATGATSNATATATVSVAPPNPTVTLSANPASIVAGASSTLTATATNATQLVITGSDGSSYTLPPAGGSQTVTPATNTTYTAIATGATGNASASVTVTVAAVNTTVTMSANPTSITAGGSSVLTVTATNATQVKITGSDGSIYTLSTTGGTQTVTPATTTTYTATATGAGSPATATATVTVAAGAGLQSIAHVVLLLQENRSFDSYFGMLNPYRSAHGWNVGDDGKTYNVDGIDDKLTKSNSNDEGAAYALFKLKSSCIDDLSSSWLESYGDVSRFDFSPARPIAMDGFVHTAENFAKTCLASGKCSGNFTDTVGKRAMGYYDESLLNYYYFMASQFAVSDRWFSPIASKSIPNRIATFTGGTTQGLAFDPGDDDHLSQLDIPNIFHALDTANVSWKIYYTVTQGSCLSADECTAGGAAAEYPATIFSYLSYSYQYLHGNPGGTACVAPTQSSSVVGDTTNSFCIDPSHIAPLSQYYTDLTNGTLPSFAFIEAGYGQNDEHPGSGQSIITGQQQMARVVNALMASPMWKSSVFFLSYDEGGGPYDHVPPVPGHSNDFTDAVLGSATVSSIPDISTIAKNPDAFGPCVPSGGSATIHCDLHANDPGAQSSDAAAQQGFAAQLGFRIPNLVISPFTRKHYVSHIPMDHTAIIKFVENRFIGPSATLTARDAAQPNLLDFFDFTAAPWATPPTPPAPVTTTSLGLDPCTPTNMGP